MRESDSHLMPTQCDLSTDLCKRLDYWYDRRRNDKLGTIDLLNTVTNSEERKIISVVALMDIDVSLLNSIVNNEEWDFICACHGYLSQRTNASSAEH